LWWIAADGPAWRVCWFAGAPVWWCSKLPRGSAEYSYTARDGSSAPGERKTKEQDSPACSTGDQRHLSDERGCRTAGCERGLVPTQVATRLREARDHSAANTVRAGAKKLASASLRVQAARLRSGSRDCGAVKLLSTQIVRKQAKALFISNDATHCMQRRRQRFPTVRMAGQVGNSEV
jgi:hypothetical protein